MGAIAFFIIAGFLANEIVRLSLLKFLGADITERELANKTPKEIMDKFSGISLGYKIAQASMVIIGIFLLGMGVYYLITYFNEKSEEDKNSINQ